MAYDPKIDAVVLTGGTVCPRTDQNAADATWLFNGARWTRSRTDIRSPRLAGIGALVYDDRLGELVYLGYPAAGGPLAAWMFDGRRWTQLHPQGVSPPAPSVVGGFAPVYDPKPLAAYDARLGKIVVLQPGLHKSSSLWLFNGSRWRRGALPTPFAHGLPPLGMAYDPALGDVVLIGLVTTGSYDGVVDEQAFGTWLFDGRQWAVSTSSPSGLEPSQAQVDTLGSYLFTFDNQVGGLVLFKDAYLTDPPTAEPAQTWLFDGRWRELGPAHSPPTRNGESGAYDSRTNTVILYGGQAPVPQINTVFADTWGFSGSNWTLLRGSPQPERLAVTAC